MLYTRTFHARRDAIDRMVMAARPIRLAASGTGTGRHWLAPAAQMGAVVSGNCRYRQNPASPMDVLPQDRDAHTEPGCPIGPRRPDFSVAALQRWTQQSAAKISRSSCLSR